MRSPGLALLLPLFCLSCATSSAAGTAAAPTPIDETPRGVRVPGDSAPWIETTIVHANATAAAVRAPGRVTFREGATSVGAPAAGRVSKVNAKVGDRVAAGDLLLTLSSPSAAASRATLESAIAAEREAQDAVARQAKISDLGVGVASEKMAAETHLAQCAAELHRA